MADQATLRRPETAHPNGAAASREGASSQCADARGDGMLGNVTNFGENLLTLAELQARLTAVELRQNVQSIKAGGAMILAGVVLGVSSFPLLLVGGAELLVSEWGFKRGYALVAVAAMTLALAGCGVTIGQRWLSRNPLGFPLAGEEFARNLNWLRTILRHSGRRR